MVFWFHDKLILKKVFTNIRKLRNAVIFNLEVKDFVEKITVLVEK